MYVLTMVGKNIRSFAFSSRETLDKKLHEIINSDMEHDWDLESYYAEDLVEMINEIGGIRVELKVFEVELDPKESIKLFEDPYRLR